MTPLIWEQGRAEMLRMLASGELDRVHASSEHAQALLELARTHVASARELGVRDPELAFAAAYDAARKALTSMLAVQGLRPTSRGGHLAVYSAALAQLEPPLGDVIKPFDWMRRTRNAAEYPGPDTPRPDGDDVAEAIGYAEALIDVAARVMPRLPPFVMR